MNRFFQSKHHIISLINMALILLVAITFSTPNFAFAKASKEYKLKAAFLYNFVKFVDWPHRFKDRKFINVCIFGSDPFAEALDPLESKSAKGLPIKVKRNISENVIKECNVLFVSENESNTNINKVINAAENTPILTIGEGADFIKNNGIISFIELSGKIRFKINATAASNVQLKISSKLLELAHEVR